MSRNPHTSGTSGHAQGGPVDLMKPGPGTPWEDRGTSGPIGAFFKTSWMGLTAPLKLLSSIRRPETAADATWFAVGCGLFWGLSSVVHNIILWFHYRRNCRPNAIGFYDLKPDTYWAGTAIQFVIVIVATVVALRFIAALYHKLAAFEGTRGGAPQVLVYNVFAYCMGPSLLAVIPLVGPVMAILWIMGLFIAGAMKRLGIKTGNAIVCMLISVFAAGAIGVVAWLVGGLLWRQVTGGGGANWFVPEKPQGHR